MIGQFGYMRLEDDLVRRNRDDIELARRSDREAADRMRRRLIAAAALAALVGYIGTIEWMRQRNSTLGRVPELKNLLSSKHLDTAFNRVISTWPHLADGLIVARATSREKAERWASSLFRRLGDLDQVRAAAGLQPGEVAHLPAAISVVQPQERVTLSAKVVELSARQTMYAAFNDGLVRAALRPEMEALIPLWRCIEIKDRVTRGNPFGEYPEPHRHWQFDGYVNTMADLVRQRCIYPLGYNCRGHHEPILAGECESKGLVFAGNVNRYAIREMNGARQALIDEGKIPDRGYVR